jgi:ABC-type phosphate transport system auxiliary subunit
MNTETYSVALDDMSVEELAMLNQGLGREEDAIREKRLHVRRKMDEKVAAQSRADIQAQIHKLQRQLDAVAPGQTMTMATHAPAKRVAKKR